MKEEMRTLILYRLERVNCVEVIISNKTDETTGGYNYENNMCD